ncbi:DedA family protein [Aurantimonas sp. Leaf443]|uniref:DedA family protein n=1 Tax=Aurantimonas sp. Leaf443 TaxID=1736378 RepID=UPI0006F38F60|nr:DedA family protein [Aurantimonas sp. Leaf443]KQT88053.1 hypothetical protein ASG48_00950 [Aurantimonas sp. Leaf443]
MTAFLVQYGYGFLALVVLLESTGLPLPGESLVVAAGMLSGDGTLNIWLVLAAAFLGSVAGDNLGYLVGRRYGRRMVVKWGSKVGLGPEKLAIVEARFRTYGLAIVLVARFVIILRQLNGFVAGMMHMPWPRFLAYNCISAALWSAAYGLGAFLFGKALSHFLEEQSTLAIVGVALGICLVGSVGTYKVLFARDKAPAQADGDAPTCERPAREDAAR